MRNKSKNIEPRNSKGKAHGLWKTYYRNGKPEFKGHYDNGNRHGYWEDCYDDGDVFYKGYYDMGDRVDYVVLIDTPSKEMFPIY